MGRLNPSHMRLARRGAGSRGGFTLVETSIALVILAAGMLTMLAVQIQALHGGRSGRHASDATAIASDRMEQLHRLAWTDPSLAETGDWTELAPIANTVQTESSTYIEQLFNVRWRVSDLDPNLKSIDVQVLWDEPRRSDRRYSISSLRHKDPGSA